MQTEVVVALIAAPPAVLIAMSQYHTSRSVGKKNGSGSLHDQMADLRYKMEMDDVARAAGVRRQSQMQEAIETLQDMVAQIREHLDLVEVRVTENYTLHATADAAAFAEVAEDFTELRQAIKDFRDLLGEPGPNDAPVPLIPYVHEWMHLEKSKQTIDKLLPTAQLKVLADAVDMMKRLQERLDETEGTDTKESDK